MILKHNLSYPRRERGCHIKRAVWPGPWCSPYNPGYDEPLGPFTDSRSESTNLHPENDIQDALGLARFVLGPSAVQVRHDGFITAMWCNGVSIGESMVVGWTSWECVCVLGRWLEVIKERKIRIWYEGKKGGGPVYDWKCWDCQKWTNF